MEALLLLIDGFAVALQPINLGLAFCGVLIGTTVGMLPGVGPVNAIAILLPLVFAAGLPAESALIFLAGIPNQNIKGTLREKKLMCSMIDFLPAKIPDI